MCQNGPGLCDEWDAYAGGNQVISVGCESLKLVDSPGVGEVIRPLRHGATIAHVDSDSYDSAREVWSSSTDQNMREVLG